MNWNQTTLGGRLTADPELRYTPKGTAVGDFQIAVNKKWKDAAGESKEDVSFIPCSAFGKTAETIAQYCRKGSGIMVGGSLKMDSWDDKQTGQKRSRLKVVVESCQFVGGREGYGAQASAPASKSAEGPESETPEDDDVPF